MDPQQQQQQGPGPCVPPGFRFHPTEEQLVGYYLARKVASQKIDLDIIREVDLYRIEPWDLQERCSSYYGAQDDQEPTEYYFFSYKDRKYPSGTRTNRATAAGFWKATGRDKPVLSSSSSTTARPGAGGGGAMVIGMRKTLVFYRGRAPNGRKTDWIIHEYRLQSNEHAPPQEEGWVVCRAFQKPMPNHHQSFYGGNIAGGHGGSTTSSYYYDARLMTMTATSDPPPPSSNSLLESKSQVHQLIADMMPPLIQSHPAAVVGQLQTSFVDHQAAAAAADSTVDWSLLSSLLPSSQLHFHQPDPPASPPSRAPSSNNI